MAAVSALYMKLYVVGVGSIYHRYMCIVLYIYIYIYISASLVKWYARLLCLIGGWGDVNIPWVYVHCAIDICQVLCSVMQGIYAWVGGSICHRSMLHHYNSPAN